MLWFIIYYSQSPRVTSCSVWSSLSVCQWQNCILISELLVEITSSSPGWLHEGYADCSCSKGEKHIKYVQSEIVCPNTKLIMNWYFPVCHSTLSEVTLIFIHHSRLCVNFQVLFKSLLNGAQTPSAALAARMIARPVWRENYKSNTPGDLFSFCVMSMHKTAWSDFIQMKYFPPSLCCCFFFMCAAYIVQKKLCSSTYEHEISACLINT